MKSAVLYIFSCIFAPFPKSSEVLFYFLCLVSFIWFNVPKSDIILLFIIIMNIYFLELGDFVIDTHTHGYMTLVQISFYYLELSHSKSRFLT